MRKSFKYALGEICIIFIGITIAFGLNKCSENSKDNKLKQQYLESITNDLKVDRLQLKTNIGLLENKKRDIDSLITWFHTNRGNPEILPGFFKISNLISFNPKDVTYQTLINSGDMSLFDDFRLRVAIEEHFSNTYKKVNTDYFRLENIHKTYLADLYIHGLEYSKINIGESPFKDPNTALNILLSIKGAIGLNMQSSEMGVKSCDELLSQIEKEL